MSQSDPKGWVPASVLQLVSSQIPLCVAGIREYFTKSGPPPTTVHAAGKILAHNFNHDTSKYDMKFTHNPNPWVKTTEIYVSPRRYPRGFNASISPETGFEAKWDPSKVQTGLLFLLLCLSNKYITIPPSQNRLIFTHLEGSKPQKFELTISPETLGDFEPLVNGNRIPVAGAVLVFTLIVTFSFRRQLIFFSSVT